MDVDDSSDAVTMSEVPLRLSSRDWLWAIGVIAAACVSNVLLIYGTRSQLEESMLAMDRRWQDRFEAAQVATHNEISELRKGIPPDWFRNMVEGQGRALERLELRVLELEKSRGK